MYYVYKNIVKIFFIIFYRVHIYGLENLPRNEALIITPNHFSNYDPLVVGSFCPIKLHTMAKKELFENKVLAKIIKTMGVFPVDRGGNDIGAIKTSLKLLKDNEPLLLFPEGTRNTINPKIHLEGKPGVSLMAIRSKVKIVPVTIDSNYKLFGRINVFYHKPIELDKYYGQKLSTDEYTNIVNEILDIIYEKVELKK